MRSLSFFIIFASAIGVAFAQSPHGSSFKLDCSECHESSTWKIDKAKISFDHSQTSFKLLGQHSQVDCRSCHESLIFADAKTDCISCHKDIHQNTVGFDCTKCHSNDTWAIKDIIRMHRMGRFPLTGPHLTAECIQCHKGADNLVFQPLEVSCFACHEQDFKNTVNPNHVNAQFSTDCQECHNLNDQTWAAKNFQHEFFPLTGGHKIDNCFSCHVQGSAFAGISRECWSCHQDDFNATTDPNHVQGNFSHDCTQCHTIQSFATSNFNHSNTAFPLTGAHTTATCASCHQSGYQGTSTACVSCHQANYNAAVNPNHQTLALPTDCQTCHTTNPGWEPAAFAIHDNFYQLIGAHASIAQNCATCHNSNYTTTPNTCYGCHQQNYQNTTNPNHVAAGFSTDCVTCHSQTGWSPANFNHDQQNFPIYSGKHNGKWNTCGDCHTNTGNFSVFSCIDCHEHNQPDMDDEHQGVSGYVYASQQCYACHPRGEKEGAFNHNISNFPLTGAHVSANCLECHQSGYAGTPTACVSCHQTNYNSTTNPNHTILSLSTDCQICHTTIPSWKPAVFPVHNNFYQLIGVHATIGNNCISCHNGNYNNTPDQCINCHQSNYNNAVNPNHTAAGIPTTCQNCHTPTGWTPSSFNHTTTGFPLTGQHATAECSSCHVGSITGLNSLCISCHQAQYNTAPNHVAQNYPTNCQMCHNSTAWNQSTFNHQTTNFPLTGVHTTTACIGCHSSGYTGTPTACVSCHQTNYNTSTNPNHQTLLLSTECQTCHTTNPDWQPATFPVHNNYYLLIGAHASIANNCVSCHNGNYNNTPDQCINCHQSNYNNAVNPNHTTAGIPTECQNCHTPTGWAPSSFNHTTTGFPLTGQHATTQCSSCHVGVITGLNSLCISCHQAQYNTAPNHVAQNYPTNCQMCHNSTAWNQSTFNHQTTNFPLTGVHTTTACIGCHSSGYTGTPTACVSCHQTNYNTSTNPNHVTLALSTTCTTCHTTNPDWQPATFPVHNNYYQLIGAHAAIANNCISCHNGNYNNTPDQCINCHQSNYNNAVNPNHTAAGIPVTCQNCHTPTGWTPSSFNHTTTGFPLTGQHATTQCSSCHVGIITGLNSLCISCHQAQYNTAPNHVAQGYPTTCLTCHNTTAWTPSTFNHQTTNFPLTGAHLAISCMSCHSGGFIGTPTACVSCHQANYNTAPNHVAQSYPTTCLTCHNTTAWTPSTFNHQTTNFPLTGAHITTNCMGCHSGGFTGTPTACVSCHQTNYNTSTNPNHVTLALSTTCSTCHTTNPDWQPATFPVHNNYYQLVGAHASIANNCGTCHNGNYNTTPNTCYGCHQQDYNTATNPNHLSAGFPHECLSCHTQTAWSPSTFNHDIQHFPIYSGQHRNEWNTCSQCHPNAGNFAIFTCTTSCHPQNQMNNEHQGISGYVYLSSACLNCHPDGDSDHSQLRRDKRRN